MRKEGVYLIKIVDQLPERANRNYLYTIRGENFSRFFEANSNTTYEEVEVTTDGSLSPATLQAGAGTTITGTGTETDPMIISVTNSTGVASSVAVVPNGNLTSTDVQAALQELQADIDGIDGSETSVTAGTNIVVTGTGTSGDPFVITATVPSAASTIPPAADDATGAVGSSVAYMRADAKAPAQAPSADPGNSLSVGTDGLHFFSASDEVVENAGPLTGAAPAGAQWGVDTTSGQAYYVSGGNWAAVPVASVDLNTTVSDETGANGAGLTTPTSAPGATPDVGDLHIEIYDDVVIYFTAASTNWTVPVKVEIPRDILNLADATTAADDAVGAGGTALTAARSDHKHAAQGISADAEQLLSVGTDGLHMLDPDDLISSDADNTLIKGTDGKLFVPSSDLPTFSATVSTGTDISPDLDSNVDFLLIFDSTSTGDINVINPVGTLESAEKVRIVVEMSDTVDRNIVFGTNFINTDQSSLGTVVLTEASGGAYSRTFEFVRVGSSNLALVLDTGTKAFEINFSRSETGLGFTSTDDLRYEFTPEISGNYSYDFGAAAPGGTIVVTVGTTLDGNDTYQVTLGSGTPNFVNDTGEFELQAGQTYYIRFNPGSGVAFDDASVDIEYAASSEGLRGEPVTDNAALTALSARDYEARKVLADGKEYVFELGAVSGTLADDAATGFWQEQIAALESTRVDASSGAFSQTLAASTDNGNVLLFTNIDLTNTATLAVQAGETLNGVTDGTFLFSNYAAGTQFRADEVTGGWVVSVLGASEVRPSNSYGLYDFDGGMQQSTNSYLRSQTGSTNLRVDANNQVTWNQGVNTNTFQIPVGTWKITLSEQFPNGNQFFQGLGTFRFGNQGADGTQPTGVTLLESHVEDVAFPGGQSRTHRRTQYIEVTQPVEGNWYYTGTNGGDTGNIYVEWERLDKEEVVLAGMVTPSPLARARLALVQEDASTALGVAYNAITINTAASTVSVMPYTEATYADGGMIADVSGWTDNNAASQLIDGTNTAMSITVPRDGKYRIHYKFPEGDSGTIDNNDRAFPGIAVNGVLVEGFDDGTRAVSGSLSEPMDFTTVLTLSAGDMVQPAAFVEGGEAEAWNLNNVTATSPTGRTVTSYFDIEEMPTSTVVMPDALEVEDINAVRAIIDVVDVGGASGPLTVISDQAVTASASSSGAETTVTLTHPSIGLDSFITTSIESKGTIGFDNDIDTVVTKRVSLTQTQLFIEESVGVAQDIRIHLQIEENFTQKTVINTTDLAVDDQSSSGYMDFGNMRIQWGISSGGDSTVTLPVPFANDSYNVQLTATSGSVAAPTDNGPRSAMSGSKTTTSFFVEAAGTASTFDWQAIGLKP